MKYTLLFFVLLSSSLFAQVPTKPEDISPILIGETLPELSLFTKTNQAISTKDLFKSPTVLVFFRGSWCPYCNVHLADLVKYESQILALGYKIVAVSPDDISNIEDLTEKNKLNYEVYGDKNGTFIKALGIAFSASDRTKTYIAKNTKGAVTEVLPVPTVLIIDEKGVVQMEYIRPDITKRLSGALLISMLKGLKES